MKGEPSTAKRMPVAGRVKRTRSMATRLTVAGSMIATIAVAVVAFVSFLSTKEMLEQDTTRALNAEVSRQSDLLEAAIERVRVDAHYLSKLDAITSLVRARTGGLFSWGSEELDPALQAQLMGYLTGILGSRGYREVQVLDLGSDGRELLRVSKAADGLEFELGASGRVDSQLVAEQVAMGRSLERGEVFTSRLGFESEDSSATSTGSPMQWFAAPVYLSAPSEQPEEPDALVVIRTLMHPILDNSWDLRSDFEVLLLDETGGYLHHSEDQLEWSYEPASNARTQPAFLQQRDRDGYAFSLGASGELAFATRRVLLNPGLDDSHLDVVLTSDKQALHAAIRSLQSRLLGFTLFALVNVTIACAFFFGRTTASIRKLSIVANRISRGESNVELPTNRHDEIGLLGRALSNVVAEFQLRTAMADHKTAQVKHLNETLETQVKARTSALGDSEARMTAIMNTTVDAFITVDQNGAVQYWNRAASKMFGTKAEDALGRSFQDFVPRDDQSDRVRGFANKVYSARSSQVQRAVEVEAVRADGSRFPVLMTINTTTINDGILVVAILRDLTAERALQLQLEQARKLEAIGSLAAGVAHEINTPTQYVTDNVRFLEEGCRDLLLFATDVLSCIEACGIADIPELQSIERRAEEADLKYLVEEMPRAIDESVQGLGSIAKIVKAMKEFSHPGTEAKTPVDLKHMVENTMTVGRHEWKYIAEIVLDFDPELPLVPCLVGDLSQVILNLIVNASHAIEERLESEDGIEKQGKITISARVVDACVELRVTDTGVGIPAEIADRIFDPFFTTKEVGKGTGQGLAIARAIIVDRHLGEMSVESVVGQGTTFVIRLPLEDSELPEVVA